MANVPRVKAETEAPGPGAGQKEAQTGRTREASDERELVRRAQAGDGDAYEVLVGRHQQRVLAVVRRVLRRSEDAEDVAQQVFIKAYFALRRFDQRAAFGTWLYKIAVNECWDYLRKKKVRPLLYDADLSEEQSRQVTATLVSSGAGSGEEIRDRLVARQQIDRLFESLDERDRLMLVMKEVEGFSVEEIGETLGLNVNTVKVRLFRARARLAGLHRRKWPQGEQRPKASRKFA
jgi:RNA polymerase sigma-70 factor, ECF subfamily